MHASTPRRSIFVPFVVLLVLAVPLSTWAAETGNEENDGFLKIHEVSAEEAWTGGVLETILEQLDFKVGQFKYENPGPHVLELSARLYIGHNEHEPLAMGKFTATIESDEESLAVAAIIRENDELMTVSLRTPHGDVTVELPEDRWPTGKWTQAHKMRADVEVGVKTPIYSYIRTDQAKQRVVFGRSDSHAVAAYEWIIIVYAEITPLKSKENPDAPRNPNP